MAQQPTTNRAPTDPPPHTTTHSVNAPELSYTTHQRSHSDPSLPSGGAPQAQADAGGGAEQPSAGGQSTDSSSAAPQPGSSSLPGPGKAVEANRGVLARSETYAGPSAGGAPPGPGSASAHKAARSRESQQPKQQQRPPLQPTQSSSRSIQQSLSSPSMSHARSPTWPQSGPGYAFGGGPPPVLGLPYAPSQTYNNASYAPQHAYPQQQWSPHAYQQFQQQSYGSPYAQGYAFEPQHNFSAGSSPVVASSQHSPYQHQHELGPPPQSQHQPSHLVIPPDFAQAGGSSGGAPSPLSGQTVYNDDGTPIQHEHAQGGGEGAFGSGQQGGGYPAAPAVDASGFYVNERGAVAGAGGGGWYNSPQQWPAGMSGYGSQAQFYENQQHPHQGLSSQLSSPALGYSHSAYGPPPPSAYQQQAPYSPGRPLPQANARYNRLPPSPHTRFPSAPSSGTAHSPSLASAPLRPAAQQQPAGGGGGGGRSPHLARGQLAQAKLHGTYINGGGGGGGGGSHRRQQSGDTRGIKSALPRPPSHSPHAMWVGNVPSDSSHEELYRFFSSRPPPSSAMALWREAVPAEILAGVEMDSNGVESVHLIARSNCCFVNFATDLHLQHAINVSNGVSLRPYDPKIKELVARVRKKDEDVKSGVGAQRTGGMHHAYVAKLDTERKNAQRARAEASEEEPSSPHVSVSQAGSQAGLSQPTSPVTPTSPRDVLHGVRAKRMSTSTQHSLSTASTNSSFLTKHFRKRFFILKAHDEADLHTSVERGQWATQTHNEPVLEQAFHTSAEVYLIFGANGTGSWFGYALMTGSISGARSGSGSHQVSSGSGSGSGSSGKKADPVAQAGSKRPGTIREESKMLFSPSEERMAGSSPQPFSADDGQAQEGKRSPLDEAGEKIAEQRAQTYVGVPAPAVEAEEKRVQSAPGAVMEAARRAELAQGERIAREQEAAGAGGSREQDEDGVWRRDTVVGAEERNKRLEKMPEDTTLADKPSHSGEKAEGEGGPSAKSSGSTVGWGRSFPVQWIKVNKLPFAATRHVHNVFNGNKNVKVSRDGTEVAPEAGELLLAAFEAAEGEASALAVKGDFAGAKGKSREPTVEPLKEEHSGERSDGSAGSGSGGGVRSSGMVAAMSAEG